jgi:hypothetical protein
MRLVIILNKIIILFIISHPRPKTVSPSELNKNTSIYDGIFILFLGKIGTRTSSEQD